jgi:hypothetical protein
MSDQEENALAATGGSTVHKDTSASGTAQAALDSLQSRLDSLGNDFQDRLDRTWDKCHNEHEFLSQERKDLECRITSDYRQQIREVTTDFQAQLGRAEGKWNDAANSLHRGQKDMCREIQEQNEDKTKHFADALSEMVDKYVDLDKRVRAKTLGVIQEHSSGQSSGISTLSKEDSAVKSWKKEWMNTRTVQATQLIKPLCYEGTGDVRAWVRLYERYADLLGWRDIDKCNSLPLFLRGDAQVWYQGLAQDQADSWQGVLTLLYGRYDAPESKWITARELSTKRLLLGQTVENFGNEVRRKQQELDLSEPVALAYFINGLPSHVRQTVSQAMPQDLQTAQRLARNAVKIHQIDDMHHVSVIKEERSEEWETLRKMILDLSQQVRQLTTSAPHVAGSGMIVPPVRRTTRGEVQCYGCGRTGHIRRNCQEPQQGPTARQ